VSAAREWPGRPPIPVLLRWPGLVLAAAVAVSWRLSEGSVAALLAPEAWHAARDLGRGFFPPAHGREFLAVLARPLVETVAIAFLGLALAAVLALPLAYLAASPWTLATPGRPPGLARRAAWAAARTLLDVMRSIPEVVWALVLVRAVGLGAAAGVAAIGIAYAGILGKVFAEIFESTAQEPAGVLGAAGASPLAAFTFATLPSALPVTASYALYRFDCALRASAVLGLVGAGGIGVQLELSMKMLAYDEVATIVLALFALVAGVDLASRHLRRRIRDGRGLLPAGRRALRARIGVTAAVVACGAASAAVLDLPLGDLLSAAPLRSLASFWASSFPPDLDPRFLRALAPAALETLAVSILGTAIAAALGLALAWAAASRPPEGARPSLPARAAHVAVVWGARAVLNLCRTMPELLWALLLVLAVGLGPFAGALALGIHTAGVLGRLYAEVLEEVAPEPIAALEAAGARGGTATMFAALPQAFPQLVGYTLYRWEVNIRASAVLGVVGAGGLGTLLHLSLSLFHVHRTLTLVLVVIVMVTAVDLASGALRRRIAAGPRTDRRAAPPPVGAVPRAVDAW
jgi:phosphonate transport system permease protein